MSKEKELECPWCGVYDTDRPRIPARLFSAGFQTVGICKHCIEGALNGDKPWRWENDHVCIRCSAETMVYQTEPLQLQGFGPTGMCLICIKAGQTYLKVAELDDLKQSYGEKMVSEVQEMVNLADADSIYSAYMADEDEDRASIVRILYLEV